MALEERFKKSPIVSILVSVISGLILGGASNYLAAQQAIASQQARLESIGRDTIKNEERIRQIERTQHAVTERMVRVETKIDILLERERVK